MNTGRQEGAHRRTDRAVLPQNGELQSARVSEVGSVGEECSGGGGEGEGNGGREARAHAPCHAGDDCGYGETREQKADDEERDGGVAVGATVKKLPLAAMQQRRARKQLQRRLDLTFW